MNTLSNLEFHDQHTDKQPMIFKNIYVIACLCLISNGHAQDLKLSDGSVVTEAQIDEIHRLLPKYNEDKVFYHWTNKATGMRWISQGYIDQGEVDFLNTPTGDRQFFGPGIYLANDTKSSKRFGEIPVVFKIKKGTPEYDDFLIRKILGRFLNQNDYALLGQRIPFVRRVTLEGWFVTNSNKNTIQLAYAHQVTQDAKVYVGIPTNWSQFQVSKDFKELIAKGDQDAIYLKNIIEASDYMDGISFARAMKINPAAPWNEFEPENFKHYQWALQELGEKRYELLANKSHKDVLLHTHKILTGKPDFKDLKSTFRDEGIRAGGDEAGNTFLVDDKQLKNLQNNPYIEVVSVPQGENRHLVHYFYPDAFHFKKLKGTISDGLYERLQKFDTEELMKNQPLRKKLNQELISELVDDFFSKLVEKNVTWEDLIAIHPFQDMNGRTVRMMEKLYSAEPMHFFISDTDLLFSKEEQNLFKNSSRLAHMNLQVELIDEFLKAKSERRMPEYLKTQALQNYVDNSLPYLTKINLDDPFMLKAIEKRNWMKVMNEGQRNGIKLFFESLELMNEGEIERLLNEKINSKSFGFYSDGSKEYLMTELDRQANLKSRPLKNRALFIKKYKEMYEIAPNTIKTSLKSSEIQKKLFVDELRNELRLSNKNFSSTIELLADFLDLPAFADELVPLMKQLASDPYSTFSRKVLADSLTMKVFSTNITKLSPLEQEKYLQALNKIIKQMVDITDTPSLLKDMYAFYKISFDEVSPEVKLKVQEPDALRTDLMSYGKSHPGKNNCTLDLLKLVFK